MILKMKLSQAPLGDQVKISGFSPEWNEKFQHRLVELGFGVGHAVTCVRKTPFRGPQIFRAGDTLYSLGKDVTDFILFDTSLT